MFPLFQKIGVSLQLLNVRATAQIGCCVTGYLPLVGGGTGNSHTATLTAEDTPNKGLCLTPKC